MSTLWLNAINLNQLQSTNQKKERKKKKKKKKTLAPSGSYRSAAGCCPMPVQCCQTGWVTATRPSATSACLTSRSLPNRSATRAFSSSPAPSSSRRAEAASPYPRAATSAEVISSKTPLILRPLKLLFVADLQPLRKIAKTTSWRRCRYPASSTATNSRNPAILPFASIWHPPVNF